MLDRQAIGGKGFCTGDNARESTHPPYDPRHAMSGYGVDVSRLMAAAGWKMERITRETDPETVKTGMLCGLVLIGR